MELNIEKIKQCRLKTTEFFEETCEKKQIYLHHTAGNSSAVSVARSWNIDTRGRIATAFVISGQGSAKDTYDGEIVQCFSSKHWAYHLGVKGEVFKAYKVPHQILDKISIGIEICNWGQLDFENGKFINYVDTEVKKEFVTELSEPFKGYKYFHKYTDAQIESVRQLLVYLGKTYKIDLSYNYDKFFKVSLNALKGENGLYTHNSVRKDKIDIYPCPRMIEMLKSLSK